MSGVKTGQVETREPGGFPGAVLEAGEAERRGHRRVEQAMLQAGDAQVTVHNVSLGGACLTPAAPVEKGDRLTLRLQDDRSGTAQELRGEVVWSRKGRIGVRWVDLSPDQFLWLCQSLGFWWGHGSRFVAVVAEA